MYCGDFGLDLETEISYIGNQLINCAYVMELPIKTKHRGSDDLPWLVIHHINCHKPVQGKQHALILQGEGKRRSKSSNSLDSVLCAYFLAAKLLQSCPTLCEPRDGSPPGSPIPGILQARTLEWVAISFSGAWKWKVKVKSLSHVRLLATTWTAAYQAFPPMGFSRQEYWSGVPLPSLISWLKVSFSCDNV